jgi:hypothetical protein
MGVNDLKHDEAEVVGDWGQGVDSVTAMLRRYDPTTRSWSLPRIGKFWDAVASAHEIGRFGEAHTIAVVDDGFDLSIPALAEQTVMGNGNDNVPSVHGTIVSLLVLAVAPKAHLLLYPTAWKRAAIERALDDVATTSAVIVNLSLGVAYPRDSVFAVEDYVLSLPPWPDMSETDVPFWVAQALGELDGWRDVLRPPQNIFEEPAATLERSGRTVVAAAGNMRGHIFDPALRASVFSVSFHRVERAMDIDGLREEAAAIAPTFTQAEDSDFSIYQPPGVLGTSMAAPLISGFAALMTSRSDLRAYAEVGRLGSMAASLMRTHHGSTWSDRRDGVIDKLFLKAIRASPHSHFDENRRSPCPECAFFAASAFINYGLFKLAWGDLDGAEVLLASAEAFAPANPHAAANLGMVYASRAKRAQSAGNFEEVSQLLEAAARLQQKASGLRPEHEPYRRRIEEFMIGAQRPREWELAP